MISKLENMYVCIKFFSGIHTQFVLVLYKRRKFVEFLNRNNIITEIQHSFRAGSSTNDAMGEEQ